MALKCSNRNDAARPKRSYSSQISRHRAAPFLGDRERTTSVPDMTISLRVEQNAKGYRE